MGIQGTKIILYKIMVLGHCETTKDFCTKVVRELREYEALKDSSAGKVDLVILAYLD